MMNALLRFVNFGASNVYVSNVRFFNKATVFTNGYLDLGAAKRTGDFNILFNGAADSITADPLGVKAETIKLPANMPYTLASTQYMQLNENTVYVLEFDYWSDTNWASADYPYFYVGGDLPERVYLQAGALPKTTLQRAYLEVSPNAQTALVRFVNFGPSSVYVCNVLFYPKYALGQKSVDLNPFRYCGEYLDLETHNYYLRARFYVPSTGRFLSEDPAKSGLNWYTYCGGNPVLLIDPWGFASVSLIDYSKAMGATVSDSFIDKEGKTRITITYNGIKQDYYPNNGKIDDTKLNDRFGWSSFLTDSDRKAEVNIAIEDGKLYKDFTITIQNALDRDEPEFTKFRWNKPFWFMDQVKPGGVSDIKQKKSWNDTIAENTYPGSYDTKIVVNGEIRTPEELGNMTYGYLGTAAGYPTWVLYGGGNYADNGLKGVFTNSDSETDQMFINLGVQWYLDIQRNKKR